RRGTFTSSDSGAGFPASGLTLISLPPSSSPIYTTPSARSRLDGACSAKFHARRILEQPVPRIHQYLLVSLVGALACQPRAATAPSPASVPDAAKYVISIADDYLAAY